MSMAKAVMKSVSGRSPGSPMGVLDVLKNVLVFSEGRDIPPLEAVGILRPTALAYTDK